MDFDVDDPLGDLLSDNSNDSFFETGPKKGSLTPAKPAASIKSGISGSAKTKLDDLFGIKDLETTISLKKQESITKPPEPAPPLKVVEPSKNRMPIQKSENVFNDDDLISDLGFDPKKPKSSKANILDDLLGPKKGSSTTPARPLTAGGAPKDDFKPISRQSTETTESTAPGTYTTSLPRPKTAGRRQSITSANDPLGFFGSTSSAKDKESVEGRDTKSTPKVARKSSPADWLGLDSDKKPSQKDSSRPASPAPPPYQKEKEPEILTIPDFVGQPTFSIPHVSSNPSQGAMLMTAATMETQNILQTLQQQESQISVVTQLKNQEIALQDIHKRQQDLLSQQEAKFNQMLQQQINRQNQLESGIKLQQDRINAYMQLAMTQAVPVSTQVSLNNRRRGTSTGDEPEAEPEMDEIQLKAEVKRLELEKLRLEDLNANINANHEKEIEFMDNSYRKQIKLLETNLQSLETRLQNELKSLEEFYNKKLKLLESENDSITSAFEHKINAIQDEHESIVKKLKSAHDADVVLLKEDFKKTIENIRESRLLEFAVVQEHSSYLNTLRTASNYLENVSGDLQTLKDELYRKVDLEHEQRQAKLNLREKKLEDAEAKLKIIEETYEGDKVRLMELVTSLEIQIRKLSQDRSEDQWTMRQKLASLEAERSTIEREKIIVREQLKRDEKRIEELKQLQIEENQRNRDQLEEERQSFFAEKAKFETSRRLQVTTNPVQAAQAELDSALKVAQDAIKQTDQERDRYLQMQRHLEAKKRELIDQENIALLKQDEYEAAYLDLKAKERRLKEEDRKHRIAEQNLTANTQLLHTQMRQVAEREARLSQDWVALLNERSEIQNLKRNLESNKCSLCRIGERNEELSKILTNTNSEIPTRNVYNINTFRNNLHQENIDTLLGDDVAHSLKKMATSTFPVNLATDLDTNMSLMPNFRTFNEASNLAPSTDRIDSEVINLKFGSENFNDE